ncbi:Uncharacterised protein [Shigella sonnei]|nr:Uncharacterised protein [Shigella sonnei]
MKGSVVIKTAVHIIDKVLHRHWRFLFIQLQFDVTS